MSEKNTMMTPREVIVDIERVLDKTCAALTPERRDIVQAMIYEWLGIEIVTKDV